MSTPEFIRIEDYRPFWHHWMVHESDDQSWWVGDFNGSPAWSDGKVLMQGKLPLPPNVQDSKQMAFDKTPTVLSALAASRTGLRTITPVAFARLGDYHCVVFSDGHVIQEKYFYLLREAWPEAEWFGDDDSRDNHQPIVIRNEGSVVALLMAVRNHGNEAAAILTAVRH